MKTSRVICVASISMIFALTVPSRSAIARAPVVCGSKGEVVASLLAVGDVGQPRRFLDLFDPGLAVAEAIASEHARSPAEALLLLGDNFYPDGLSRETLRDRLRMNVIGPFCSFLSLGGLHRSDLESACTVAETDRHPRPIIVVLGNHDYGGSQSAELEKFKVPRWIPEWQMPTSGAEVYELPGSISVIALDSVALHRGGDVSPLVEALRRSHGDWRILIAHHPLVADGYPWEKRYVSQIQSAVAETGKPIQMMLAGHEHLLAVGLTGLKEVPLQLIAGSGASARPAKSDLMGEVFSLVELGFVRIDLIRDHGEMLLRAKLIKTADSPIEWWNEPSVVECYWVDHGGIVRESRR